MSPQNSPCRPTDVSKRATVVGIVISGFGLSAFLFSTIAHVIFPGDTSEFLLVLAIGTSVPMILGFFFVRPVPLPHSEYARLGEDIDAIEEDEFSSASPVVFSRENNSHTHLLGAHVDDEYMDEEHLDASFERRHAHEAEPTDYIVPPSRGALALSPTRSENGRHRSRSTLAISRRREEYGGDKLPDGLPNIRGTALASSANFWLLFTMCSLRKPRLVSSISCLIIFGFTVSGTGLMCKCLPLVRWTLG